VTLYATLTYNLTFQHTLIRPLSYRQLLLSALPAAHCFSFPTLWC